MDILPADFFKSRPQNLDHRPEEMMRSSKRVEFLRYELVPVPDHDPSLRRYFGRTIAFSRLSLGRRLCHEVQHTNDKSSMYLKINENNHILIHVNENNNKIIRNI